MKKGKRAVAVFLVMLMLWTVAPLVYGAEIVDGGTCGDNLTWTLDDAGVLTISGTGEMFEYGIAYASNGFRFTGAPWGVSYQTIKCLVIEDGVTSISEHAFQGCCNMTSVTIPDSVTSIGSWAFHDCEKLTSVLLGNGVTSIKSSTFSGCSSLTEITIPNNVTSIDAGAFSSCRNLESITIPDGVTRIGELAFGYCNSLTSVTIGAGVTYIDAWVFEDCSSLTSISVSENNQNFASDENGSLYNKRKTTILRYPAGSDNTSFSIPDSVTRIEYYAFSGCSKLTSITIPNGVTHIETCAFLSCSSLAVISIPNSVTDIARDAFSDCGNLTDIYYCGTADEWSALGISEYVLPLENVTLHYHNPKESVIENEAVTICTVGGSYDVVVYCALCGEELSRETIETTAALGHADDNNDGHCDRCGEQMQGGDHCKFCGKIHNGGFFDKLTGFFHKIFAIFKR